MKERVQIEQLNGIRGFAFIMILLDHAGLTGYFLWSSLDLFFVLSGFLITGILLSQQKNDDYFKIFYARRFLRVFPAFYISLIVGMLALRVVSQAQVLSIATFTANIYMPFVDLYKVPDSYWALGPFWSLAVEEQFYLIWPLIVFRLDPKRLLWVCGLMIITAPILRGLAYQFLYLPKIANYDVVHMFTWNRMDLLAAGSAIAACRHLKLFEAQTLARFGVMLGGVSAILLGLAVLTMPDFRFSGHSFFFSTIGFTMFGGLMTGVIMYLANSNSGPIVRFFSFKPLAYAGTISYTMYLIHGTILSVLEHDFGIRGIWQLAAVAFVITFTLAAISWHLMELPIKNLKDRRL